MEEYRDDIKSKLHYMDEILHKISFMSQAENEKQLDDMTHLITSTEFPADSVSVVQFLMHTIQMYF